MDPAAEVQASDRVHRMGQTRAVTIYTYVCLNTIEERIAQILKQKQALFEQLVDGVSVDPLDVLTSTELFGLFDLPSPR